jgi:hypothetical protein
LDGHLFSISPETNKIYRGSECFAGSGIEGHKDGDLLEAQFSYPDSIVEVRGSIYITDHANHCIRRIEIYKEWNISSHNRPHPMIQNAVKTILLMRNRNTLWRKIPREIAFVICKAIEIVSF